MADTGFATGLLSGINQNIAQQRKNVSEGDKAQVESFQEAAREYQTAKNKVSDQTAKIDAMANILTGGKPDAAAYSTARDAVEMGYTDTEHLPYVQDAYTRTKADMDANPDKWNVSPNSAPNTTWYGPQDDTNPTNTASIHKYMPNTSVADIEAVRQNDITRPYNNLPGASWGNAQEAANAQIANKTRVENQAKTDIENQNMGWGGFGGNQSASTGTPAVTNPQTTAAAGSGNPMAMPASQLTGGAPAQTQAPSTAGGINLQGSANDPNPMPPDNTKGLTPPPPIVDYTKPVDLPPPGQVSRGEQVSGVTLNTDYLRTLPPLIQGQVQGIANGTMKPPQGMGSTAIMFRQKLLAAVKEYDPSFDETTYGQRQAAATALNNPASKVGQQIISMNRLAQHMDKLDKSIDALPNLHGSDADVPMNEKGPPLLTGVENSVHRMEANASGGKEAAAYSTFEENKKAVVDEMTRLWRGTGGSAADIASRSKELDSANTPEQLHAAMAAAVGLIHGQVDPIQDNMDRVLGPHSRDIMAPKTRAIFDRLEARQNPQANGQGQAAPIDKGIPITVRPSDASAGTPDYSGLWNGGGQQ